MRFLNRMWIQSNIMSWRWKPELRTLDAMTCPISRIYMPTRRQLFIGRWLISWWIKRYEADACKHGSQCRSGTPPMLTTIDRTVCVCGDWKVVEY